MQHRFLACAAALGTLAAPALHAHAAQACDNGLCLTVTVAADNGDPAQCGTADHIDASPGDLVNVCYTVVNQGSVTLNRHSLRDATAGALFEYVEHPLAPGASWQYNRRFVVGADGLQADATWTATDRLPNYTASAGAYAFIDVTTTGTRLNLPNDAGALMQLPFPFTVYDVTAEHICIDNDGVVILGLPFADACASPNYLWNNEALPYTLLFPTTGVGKYPLLMPLWADSGGVYGNVYFGVVGAAPNRKAVVEWYQVESGYQTPGTGEATYELVFDEASGRVSFQYQDMTFSDPAKSYLDYGGDATVGIAYDATLYDPYSYRQQVIQNLSAIEWTPVTVARAASNASAAVAIGTGSPAIEVAPAALTTTLDSGATTTLTLALANRGSADLAWHFGNGVQDGSAQRRPQTSRTDASAPAAQAYGFSYTSDGGSGDYSLIAVPDLGNPSSADVIAPAPLNMTFTAGAFVNDDFAHVYLASNSPAYDGSTDWGLYTLGVADAALARIGTLSTYDSEHPFYSPNWRALAWDATTATLYGVATSMDFARYSYSTLYAIDPTTATTRRIGAQSHGASVQAIAFDADGRLYGIDFYTRTLVSIDKTDGAMRTIGPLGDDLFPAGMYSAGLAFAADGTLYYDAGGKLVTIDVVTGAATLVGPLFEGTGTDAFALAVPSPCTAAALPTWLSLDAAGGSLAPSASATITATFDASGLAPGTYATDLCVHANDPSRRLLRVPVTLTVSGSVADRIFGDGFDG
jgi:hypothetical protein